MLDAVVSASVSEATIEYYAAWLDEQFPDANVTALIYCPDEWFDDPSTVRDPTTGAFKPEANLSNQQILAYAMLRSGRILPGVPADVTLPFPMPRKR